MTSNIVFAVIFIFFGLLVEAQSDDFIKGHIMEEREPRMTIKYNVKWTRNSNSLANDYIVIGKRKEVIGLSKIGACGGLKKFHRIGYSLEILPIEKSNGLMEFSGVYVVTETEMYSHRLIRCKPPSDHRDYEINVKYETNDKNMLDPYDTLVYHVDFYKFVFILIMLLVALFGSFVVLRFNFSYIFSKKMIFPYFYLFFVTAKNGVKFAESFELMTKNAHYSKLIFKNTIFILEIIVTITYLFCIFYLTKKKEEELDKREKKKERTILTIFLTYVLVSQGLKVVELAFAESPIIVSSEGFALCFSAFIYFRINQKEVSKHNFVLLFLIVFIFMQIMFSNLLSFFVVFLKLLFIYKASLWKITAIIQILLKNIGDICISAFLMAIIIYDRMLKYKQLSDDKPFKCDNIEDCVGSSKTLREQPSSKEQQARKETEVYFY